MSNRSYSITILLFFGLLACGEKEQNQAESGVSPTYCLDSTFRERIELTSPVYEKVAEAIHLTGSVEANPDRVVTFVSLVSGVVTSVSFSIGDRVQKGQVLAELHSTGLSALQSEKNSLTSRIEVAEQKVKSIEAMHRDGISSERELMEARSELDILRSELARTSADLDLYSASISKGVFQVKAPASGVVTFKSITPGSQISPESGPLFTISDLSQIWILANVHATSVKNIVQGMEVGITTLSYPDENFRGRISNISSVMDQEAKVLKARIELPNRDMKLKPGMLVDINAFKPIDRTALSLPTSALVFDDNRHYVITYGNDCNLAIRRVGIISQNNHTTYLETGLDSTDTVISKNQLLIFEQLKNFQK